MNNILNTLEPASVWNYFREITLIPRPSKKEEKIIQYLIDFSEKHGLEWLQDSVGNILIKKKAVKGFEHLKTVVLQSHVDMVCEKNSDKEFDFDNDPIETRIVEGWVKANGTTLGADDGIGIAAQLALLASNDIEHGPIECLFTVDEETGLTGAFGLDPTFMNGRILLNLDSEDEGELFIGCAGGKDTVIRIPYTLERISGEYAAYQLKIGGLKGGHSGDDIHKGLGNANKLLNRILWQSSDKYELRLNSIQGGNLRNAIAREAEALFLLPRQHEETFLYNTERIINAIKAELAITEPGLFVKLTKWEEPITEVVIKEDQAKLLNSIYACPHGVIAWSQSIPGFVETSTNLASIRMEEGQFLITTSQRSSVESAKEDIANMVKACFLLTGAEITQSNGYPGWAPNPDSEIREITVEAYRKLFGQEPHVKAIHAGLECGLIGDKYPGMDMISYGPTIKGAHSPDERIEIASVQKFWDLTLEILSMIPSK